MSDLQSPPRFHRGLLLAALLPVAGFALVVNMVLNNPDGEPSWLVLPVAVAIGVPGVVGFLILRPYPRHPIGWLLSAHAFLLGVAMSTPPEHVTSHAALVLGQVSAGWWVFLYVCLVLIGYLFPNGHFRNRRWRRWTWTCLAGYLVFIVAGVGNLSAFHDYYPTREAPLPVLPSEVVGVLSGVGLLLVALSLLGTVACARLRLRDATGEERLQLLWFTWAAISIPAILAVCFLDSAVTGDIGVLTVLGVTVFGSVIPIAIGIAVLRSRLFDIELVLSRTLTYAVLTAGVIGTYALALWLTDRFIGNGTLGGLIGVGVVAVLLQPAHSWLRHRIERRVYGDRNDPGTALRRLADRVEGTVDPGGVVESVTASVVDALRVDRAWIERDGVSPDPAEDRVVRVPLTHRGERLGDLAVAVPRGRNLSTADLSLLHDLARHAAVVVQAATLATDLQESRARLVRAREEERRRLRRDLHDGVGPSLAAIVLKLSVAQRRSDDASRAELLAQTMEETRAAIAEVRRLVDDLRPPAIDEVGLIGAIRQRAASLTQGTELSVEVSGPAALPTLPAAVEVAAFRIATEALTNVIRHSGATHCLVHVAVNGAFELTVSDNGRGAALGTSSGVGWTSMSERAGELGGACTVSSRSGGGLVVRAVLPHEHSAVDPVEAVADTEPHA